MNSWAIPIAFAACCAVVALPVSAEDTRPPRGLYAYSYPAFIRNGDWEKALSVKGIDGAAVVMKWVEIEPARRAFDFSELDRRVKLVRSRGLSIELGILAGGNAPAWIYEPTSANKGAARLDFAFSHHGGQGQLIKVTMAPPWDPVYQAEFAELLGRVARHLRDIDALQYVSVVKLTGVNTDTDEIRLPAETPEKTRNRGVSNAMDTWVRAGYRPSLVVEATREVSTAWARAFPGTWMVLPIIPENAFPPIGEDGRVAAGRGARSLVHEVLGDVVAAAEGATRGHFVLQMDWLMADASVRPEVMELARKLSVPVAWQTNFYFGREGKGAACGGEFRNPVRCDDASYFRLLQAGIHPQDGSGPSAKGAFIEVFPPDAIAFGDAIARAHEEMSK